MPSIACVPVAIPRWQWRTFAADLSWLPRRLSPAPWVEGRPACEIHLVCRHSAHHAWLCGGVLTLQWRKEVAAEGFELWDTILRADEPFLAASLERLFSAWGLAAPRTAGEGLGAAALLTGPIAATPSVRAFEVVRRSRRTTVDGICCVLEALTVAGRPRGESFAIEHEDPALLGDLLRRLGLQAAGHTNFLHGLKRLVDAA